MNEQTVIRAKKYIQKLFEGNSDGHDAAHSLRVYRNAMLIADATPGCDRYAVEAPYQTAFGSNATDGQVADPGPAVVFVFP